MEKFDKIALNIPHSSFNGIFDYGGWNYNANFLNQVIKNTDWHTDFLFHDDNKNIVPIVFNLSYAVVDVESIGYYTTIGGYKRELSEEKENWLMQTRDLFLERLSEELTESTLLIDCHSFNEETSKDIDVCIGFNEDWSKPSEDTIKKIVAVFEGRGYKVGINNPYGGSITPTDEIKYKSIKIGVNKKLYLRNGIEINTSSFYSPKLHDTIKQVYKAMLGENYC